MKDGPLHTGPQREQGHRTHSARTLPRDLEDPVITEPAEHDIAVVRLEIRADSLKAPLDPFLHVGTHS